jgi:hypothetical protein
MVKQNKPTAYKRGCLKKLRQPLFLSGNGPNKGKKLLPVRREDGKRPLSYDDILKRLNV